MRVSEPTPMRRAIARRMTESKREAPHFYVSAELSLDGATALLEQRNAGRERGERISMTAVLVRAAVVALRRHPQLNAVWDGETLTLPDDVNVGVAIALDDGLVAPALLAPDTTSLESTAAALRDLVARARARRLRGAEMTGATFTVTNLGMFGVSSFIPIVTPPQVAILATGAAARLPRYDADGSLVARSVLTATVSADHRAVDGADVARFLDTLAEALSSPEEIDA